MGNHETKALRFFQKPISTNVSMSAFVKETASRTETRNSFAMKPTVRANFRNHSTSNQKLDPFKCPCNIAS